ncbi:MAG: aldehyde dehydrogenase family protein [Rhodobacteraceae bacterium]|nr:aldehyde dehydrogenase family protein [Paracoccaceae bacterium]MBR9822539.1 aldehyde dehydrogenase family protein [Paracoccaceae bacterium]
MGALSLPTHQGQFYGGGWHASLGGALTDSLSPSTAEAVGKFSMGSAADVDAAVFSARDGFRVWSATPPLERARIMREVSAVITRHGRELAMLDAADGGNPVAEMSRDAANAAAQWQFFAGLVTEMKGDTIPMGPDVVNFSTREPFGVVARIVAFNHPFMFTAAKAAAPIAAGNAVIMKPPEQAPLSALRLAELIGGLLPDGVFNVLTGGAEVGQALSTHDDISVVTLIGSVPTGRAVMKSASDTLKPVLLELGGKNALIGFPDADPEEVAEAVVSGMNFIWCGQSCGSTSRAFLHEDIHDAVLEKVAEKIKRHKPGLPTDDRTTMGALISKAQYDKTLSYIEIARSEGAELLCGGKRPDDPALDKGYFVEPTVFHGVTQQMRIASEEVFGPVLSILKWQDWDSMIEDVNAVEYGLTCSIWTNDLNKAHRTASRAKAGFIWVNEVSKHFLGTPFGGFKQSGIGREECLSELMAFTQEKNIHIRMK